jgi:hypothetical protein
LYAGTSGARSVTARGAEAITQSLAGQHVLLVLAGRASPEYHMDRLRSSRTDNEISLISAKITAKSFSEAITSL